MATIATARGALETIGPLLVQPILVNREMRRVRPADHPSAAVRCSRTALMGAALAILGATAALADPCNAIPDHGTARVEFRAPRHFSGPVTYVGDGDSLCVAATVGRERDPNTWIEVRVSDFYAPELSAPGGAAAKAALVRIAMGRRVECLADHQSYDRLVAFCKIGADSLGDLMRGAGVREGGRGR